MVRFLRLGVPTTVAVTLVLAPLSGRAGELVRLGGEIAIASDYMFRGVSQTMSGETLQGYVSVDHTSGFYGWLFASNVDFTEPGASSDGIDTEIDATLGYRHEWTDRVSVDIGFTSYRFPGARSGIDYDYGEWIGSVSVDTRHALKIGFSDDAFASGRRGTFYAASTVMDPSPAASVAVEVGYYDLDRALGASYSYAELATLGNLGIVGWRLSYFVTGGAAAALFGAPVVSDRLVLRLSVGH